MQRILSKYNKAHLSFKSTDNLGIDLPLFGNSTTCVRQVHAKIITIAPGSLVYSGRNLDIGNVFYGTKRFTSIKPVIVPYQSWPLFFQNGVTAHCNYSTDSGKRKKISESPVTIDSFGAWDNNFELPLLMEASITYGKPIPLITEGVVGSSSELGKRSYQEDRYFIKDIGKDILCCAVFDGHGGDECSSFCAENTENILKSKLLDKSGDLEHILHEVILELNSSYTQWVSTNSKGEKSGSTCTICLIKGGRELVIGHLGDSRVLLCRRGGPRRLTIDHCPSNITERNRIEKSGGSVITDNIGRHMVNGALSMSRSIGDLHLKRYGVSALPDTRKIEIKHGHDSFLMLTTDGINFVLNDEEICNIVNHAQDPESAARALTEQASTMSSEDNLTALIIPLGSWGNFAKSAASMFYSFGIGRNMSKSSRFG